MRVGLVHCCVEIKDQLHDGLAHSDDASVVKQSSFGIVWKQSLSSLVQQEIHHFVVVVVDCIEQRSSLVLVSHVDLLLFLGLSLKRLELVLEQCEIIHIRCLKETVLYLFIERVVCQIQIADSYFLDLVRLHFWHFTAIERVYAIEIRLIRVVLPVCVLYHLSQLFGFDLLRLVPRLNEQLSSLQQVQRVSVTWWWVSPACLRGWPCHVGKPVCFLSQVRRRMPLSASCVGQIPAGVLLAWII